MTRHGTQVKTLPLADLGRMAQCGQCWQVPGKPCTPEGSHLARYIRALRRALITDAHITALTDALDAFTLATVVPDILANRCGEHVAEQQAGDRPRGSDSR